MKSEKIVNNFIKIIIFATLIIFMALGSANLIFATGSDEGIAFSDKPDIRLSRYNIAPIKAKDEFTLTLKLDNKSPAYGVIRGKLTLNTPEGLSIMNQSNAFFIDSKGIPIMGSNTVDVKLKASDKLTSDSMQLGATLEYTYWGRDGMASGTENYTILLPAIKTDAISDDGAPIIQVVRDKIKPVEAKKSYELQLKIKNINAKTVAKNIKMTFTNGTGFSIKTRKSNKFIDELKKGEPLIIPLKIKTAKTIDSNNLDLTVNLSYTYDQNGTAAQGSDTEHILIPSIPTDSEKENENSTLTPNIIISKYDYGKKVEAGQKFKLNMSFKNTSKDTEVKNIVLSMTTAEGISIASSSNSFYFDSLKAGGELPVNVELKAWEEAKSAAAVVTINFNYEYKVGKSITKGTTSESISIPVIQPDRFEIKEEPNPIDEGFVGEEVSISIPYVNKGKATASNISAKITGDGFEALSKDIWVGNCSSGSSGSIDIIVTPNMTGDLKAEVIVEYEDANLEKKTKKIPVSFFVNEPAAEEPPVDTMPEDTQVKKTNPYIKMIIIAVVIIVVIVVLVIVIKKLKKRANKKRMERLSHMYDWALGKEDEIQNTKIENKNDKENEKENSKKQENTTNKS